MTKILRPKEGDVTLVSGAAGAVGSTAGQIAKLRVKEHSPNMYDRAYSIYYTLKFIIFF